MTFKRLLLLCVLLAAGSESALALPVFARRYETSCTTCHAIIPKLNPFGIAFRNNGYRIPLADEKLLKTQDISLGAPAWKQLWPKAVWPGKIPGMPPIAFRADADVDVAPSQPVHTNFDFPNSLSIYFVGPAGDTLSFFADLFLIGATNQLFIDRAWAQFRLTPEKAGTNWAVLKVGRIDLRAEPFSSTYRKVSVPKAANDAEAVVYIDKIPGKTFPRGKSEVLDQINLKFVPHVMAALVGTTVLFPNSDVVRHNVFSPGPTLKFSLGTYPVHSTKEQIFSKPGVVTLLCNIHAEMSAYVVVTETPFFAISDAQGNYTISNVPSGKYVLKAWHEKGKPAQQEITVEAVDLKGINFELKN